MKNRRKILLLMLLIIMAIPVGITFSKYVYDFVGNYLIRTNQFYFNSDKLSASTINYNINNWGGAENFSIQFELNNHDNNLLISDADIEYNISLICSEDVSCSINATSGVIYREEMTDNFTLVVTPLRVFDADEEVNVSITATSSSPFVKTLGANFKIVVGKKGISYEINDEVNQPYFDFTITNSKDEYTVASAFDDYSVGSQITTDVYKNLSSTNKEKCYSARITLTFDPHDVIIDTTSDYITNSTYSTTRIDGIDYVSSITFDVDAMSSNTLRFYKIDVSEDYTYPFGTSSSIVTFNAL